MQIRYFLLFLVSTFDSLAQNKELNIKHIFVDGKEVSLHQKIVFNSSQNDILIEADLILDDSVQYLCRLKELSEQWTKSSYPVVHFQKLESGFYTFEMKAKVQNFETKPISISIVVESSFWQTWYFWPFIAFYIVLIGGVGIYLFFLYDYRQKLKVQNIRNQIAADLHDEVGSNLNSIAIFVEVLRKKSIPENLPLLDRIIGSARESVSLMQDTVWTINPKNDTNEKLFTRMSSFASEILSNKGISLDLKIDEGSRGINFSMEQRKNYYLIFKEAVNNIAKHSEATKAEVQISVSANKIYTKIKDNGKGFDVSLQFEGNGLSNFRKRAEENEMIVSINSAINEGTTIGIEVVM